MKRANYVFSFLLIMLGLGLSANAQTSTDRKLRIGLKGGLNVAGLNDENIDDRDPRLGFMGGAFLKIPLSDRVAFQPELLYTMKGGKLNYKEGAINGTATFHFDYIELPLLAVINITPNFNLHGGVYVASLINGKFKNDANFNGLDTDGDLETDDFENLDYGLTGGVAIDIDRVSIGARYEYGMKTIGKERSSLGESYELPDAKNSVFQFYIAISVL